MKINYFILAHVGHWRLCLKDWQAWTCQVSLRGNWHIQPEEDWGYCSFLPQLRCNISLILVMFILIFSVWRKNVRWHCFCYISGASCHSYWLSAHWHLWRWICKLLYTCNVVKDFTYMFVFVLLFSSKLSSTLTNTFCGYQILKVKIVASIYHVWFPVSWLRSLFHI